MQHWFAIPHCKVGGQYFVLYTNTAVIVFGNALTPSPVGFVHHLGDLTIAVAHHIMGTYLTAAVFKPANGTFISAYGYVVYKIVVGIISRWAAVEIAWSEVVKCSGVVWGSITKGCKFFANWFFGNFYGRYRRQINDFAPIANGSAAGFYGFIYPIGKGIAHSFICITC